MEKKSKKILKQLLTTASAVAVFSTGVNSALAVPAVSVIDIGAAVILGGGAANTNPAFNNGDNLRYNTPQVLSTGAAASILSIDINGKALSTGGGKAFTVAHATSLGSVFGAPTNADRLNVVVNADLTLTGTQGIAPAANTYTGLGNLTIGNGIKLKVDLAGVGADGKKSVVFEGAITGAGPNNGIIEIAAGNIAQFNGIIGGVALRTLNLAGDGAKAIFKANATFDRAGANGVEFAHKNAELTIANGVTVAGIFKNTTGADGAGVLNIEQDATIDGTIGAAINTSLREINIGTSKAGTFTLTANTTDIRATDINFKKDSVIALGAAARTITGNIVNAVVDANAAPVNNQGGFTVGNANHVILGNLGASGASLKNITYTANTSVTTKGANFYVSELTNDDANKGKLTIGGAAADGKVTIVTSTAKGKALTQFNIDARDGVANTTLATIKGGSNIKTNEANLAAGQDHELAIIGGSTLDVRTVAGVLGNFNFNTAPQKLILGDDNSKGTLIGNVVSVGGAGKGIIEIGASEATIQGQIGNAAAIAGINFTKAGGSLVLDANAAGGVIESPISFGGDTDATTKLVIKNTGANNTTITGAITVAAKAADGRGAIVMDSGINGQTLTVVGAIGDVTDDTQMLNLIDVKNNNLTLQGGDAHINTIKLAGNSTIKLNKAATYRIHDIDHANNTGKLQVSENVTIQTNFKLAEGQTVASLPKLNEFNIDGNKTVTIKDGSYILATKMTNGVNNGTLVFEGDVTFDAPNQNKILDIVVNAKDKVVKYLSNVNTHQNLTFGINGGTFEFYGEKLEGNGNLVANVAGLTPVLKFARTQGLQTVAMGGAGANAQRIKMVFAGTNVTMNKDIVSTEFEFTSTQPITVTFGDQELPDASNFTVTSEDVLHKVSFGTDRNFTGNLGAKPLAFEVTKAAADVTVNSANAQYAQFSTTQDDAKFTVGNNTVAIGSIGTSAKQFNQIVFDNNADLKVGDVYGKTITAKDGKTVIFTGDVNAPVVNNERKLVLGDTANGANANAKFTKEGLILATKVQASGDNKGTAEFADINSTVAVDMGTVGVKLNKVSFLATSTEEATKKSNIAANIYSTDIEFGKGSVVAKIDEIKLDGNVKFDGSTVVVGRSAVTGNSIAFKGSSVIETTFDGTKSGKLINAANGALTFAEGSKLDIVINDLTGGIARDDATVTVLDNQGNTVSDAIRTDIISKATVTVQNNSLVNWVLSVGNNGTIKLNRENKAFEVLSKDIKEQLGVNAREEFTTLNLLLGADKNSDAGKFMDSLATQMDSKTRAEAIERIVAATQQNEEAGSSNVTAISQRLGTLMTGSVAPSASITPNTKVASTEVTGVSAGDETERFGVWGMPFFGTATQSKYKGAPGYKSESTGGTLGFDTKVNDSLVFGGAFTYASSDVKHKDSKKGDKTKSDSAMFSVYGLQKLTDCWFAQAVGTVGDNSVTTESIRIAANNKREVARGKYSSMSFAGQALVGYSYALSGVEVTPMVGVGFTRVNDGSYKETGTTNQNLDISKKASNKLEGILGTRMALSNVQVGEALLTPEVHGFVYHNFNKKDPQVAVRMDGIKSSLPQKSNKSVKTTFNAGVGLTAKHGMMEYGAGYDAHMATKYLAHQGTLKVRVNF